MAYIVSVKDKIGGIHEESEISFELALEKAKCYEGVSVKIINKQNGLEVWNSNNDKELRVYQEYSWDNWNVLTEGHHEKENSPSIYFDIDGTLGKWYEDGRGFTLEEILDPTNHYFRDIEPYDEVIKLAEVLHEKGLDVCIISSADKNTIQDKWEWIEEHLPFIPKENICFSPLGSDKSNFVKGNAEISILIDDYNVNLDQWKGEAMKILNGVNSPNYMYDNITDLNGANNYKIHLVAEKIEDKISDLEIKSNRANKRNYDMER